MPRDHKKRGRREEKKKRKLHEAEENLDLAVEDQKRLKTSSEHADHVDVTDGANGVVPAAETPFYGLLDAEEQQYFKRADEMLEMNQFQDPEEKDLFLANVFREADGKELKMASSQSCSRLMERLIFLSSASQLKTLFQKFSNNFLHLVDHRFASHCCEALFTRSATVVTHEITDPPIEANHDEIFVSMENLFLHALNELEGSIGYLLTSRYASHVLRVLLVVLSGLPLSRSDSRSLLQGRGKEKVIVSGGDRSEGVTLGERPVPKAFLEAIEKLSSDGVGSMDTSTLRTLATHPTGNPTLQLLIQIELTKFGKQRAKDEASIIRILLPDDPITDESESGKFVNGLVYDPVGSRLLETIVEFAPGKMFKSIYRHLFKERMGSLARNEIAGYVAARILQRLGKDDLQEAVNSIMPQLSSLIERKRIAIIKTMIERCHARGLDTGPIARELQTAYGGPNGFDITRLLKLADSPLEEIKTQDHTTREQQSDKLHGSLLAQSMLTTPGPLSDLMFDAFARLGEPLCLKISKDTTASRALQAALTSEYASIIFRRKMIQKFYGNAAEMALDPSASHVIDAIWNGTQGLAFIRERIAEELAENEAALRESFVGRAVWKNWQMDLYKRRRADWVKKSRSNVGSDGFVGFPEESNGVAKTPPKSALDLAREKHVAMKAKKEKDKKKEDRKGSKKHKAVE